MTIFSLTNEVPAVWLDTFAKVVIWLNHLFIWFSMDASASIPWVIALHILDAMDKVRASVSLTLTEVLRLAQDV